MLKRLDIKEMTDNIYDGICEHTLPDHNVSRGAALDPAYIEVLLSPEKINGYPDTEVRENAPLVAFARTECVGKGVPCRTFFAVDRFIGGVSEKNGRPFFSIKTFSEYDSGNNLLPWYHKAIEKYLLPDGWTMKDWVLKSPHGGRQAITSAGKFFFDQTLDGDDDEIEKMLTSRGLVSYYVQECMDTPEDRREDHVNLNVPPSELMDIIRNVIVPKGIEGQATREAFGYDKDDLTEKDKRQAMFYFVSNRLGVPIPVFEPVYNWPS